MIKVSILKDNIQTHGASFPTLDEANQWIASCEEIKAFGDFYEEYTDELGEIIPAKEKDYQIVIEDVSAQVEQEQALARRKEKRAFGESMIDFISLINESASVNESTLEALILDQDFMVIREHLYSGSILSAYNKILATEVKILTVFSQDNLNLLKSKLQAKLQELGEL